MHWPDYRPGRRAARRRLRMRTELWRGHAAATPAPQQRRRRQDQPSGPHGILGSASASATHLEKAGQRVLADAPARTAPEPCWHRPAGIAQERTVCPTGDPPLPVLARTRSLSLVSDRRAPRRIEAFSLSGRLLDGRPLVRKQPVSRRGSLQAF